MLDPTSPVPLYRQLADRLQSQIRAGEYAVGARIPSEPTLSEAFGIARPTVRQATDLLVQRGMLERRRGSGTFVREPQARVDMFSRAGTLRSFRDSGLAIRARWLGPATRRRVVAGAVGPAAGHLPNPFVEREALVLSRLSRVQPPPDGETLTEGDERASASAEPVLLERFWLDPELFAPLEGLSLADVSLSELVEARLGLRPSTTEQVFDVVALEARDATQLAVAVGTPMLRVQRLIGFSSGSGVIYAVLYCRTDRLAFCQTITGVDHA